MGKLTCPIFDGKKIVKTHGFPADFPGKTRKWLTCWVEMWMKCSNHCIPHGDFLISMDWLKGKSTGKEGFYMFLHVFTIKGSGFSCKMSHHPILWFVLSIFVGWRFAGDQDLPTCLKHVETRNSWCRDHILSHCLTTWFWPVTTGPSFRTEKGALDEERCTAWELEQAQGSVAQQRG